MNSHLRQNHGAYLCLFAALALHGCGKDDLAPTEDRSPAATASALPVAAMLGADFDLGNVHPSVGALVTVSSVGMGSDHCSATLVAPDVLLTAAHCVPSAGLIKHLWAPLPALGRLYWVPAEKPFPLASNRHYEVVGAVVPKGYSPDIWENYTKPLYMRTPANYEEGLAFAAFEEACGDGDRWFDKQARLACLTTLSPELQRALGVPNADYNGNDVALMFLAEPVRHLRPVSMAADLVTGELAPPLHERMEARRAAAEAAEARKASRTQGQQAPNAADSSTDVLGELLAAVQEDAEAQPTRRPDDVVPRGAPVTVVGYGFSSLIPSLNWLLQAPMGRRTVADATVWAAGSYQFQLREDAPVCWGDSGGPVLQRQANGALAVVGVTSSMLPKTPPCGKHSLFMRVDAFRPWIQDQLEAACREGRRIPSACRLH